MAKINREMLVKIVTASIELNWKGKRLASSKMEVCEKIAETIISGENANGLITLEIKLKAYAELISKFLNRETYLDFWAKYDKENAKAVKPKFSNKLAADTMQGTTAQKLEQMTGLKGKRFIVTSAQNNTQVTDVFSQLEALAKDIDAQLIVIPFQYNKNAFSAQVEKSDVYFASDVKPFLQEADCWIGQEFDVRLAVSANVLPTAKYPVNAAATLNAGELVTVIGSPKQQLKTLPRLNKAPIKEAWTTGTCTAYNYTESRAGAEAEVEHIFGGLLIDIDNYGSINVTNIRQHDGSLALMVDNQQLGVNCTLESPCVVLGDLHCEMQDESAYNKTLEWLEAVSPAKIAVHDILHFATRSHHNRHSGKHLYKMYHQGQSVYKDLLKVIEQLNEIAQYTDEVYIVESNHNSALDNWLDDASYSPKQDPENAKLYYIVNWAVCESIDAGEDRAALQVTLMDIVKQTGLPELAENIRFGYMDEPEMWYGFDVSQHGHKGANGSNGSPTQLSKWRLPLVTGHTHSPSIIGNVYTVGVLAKLNQGYNRGGSSSWNQSNMVIHSNGTCQVMRVDNLSK